MKQILLLLTALLGAQLITIAAEQATSDRLPGEPADNDNGHSDHTLINTATKPFTFNIWPGRAPFEIKELPPEADTTKASGREVAGKRVIRLGNVSTPQITISKPDAAINAGTSVIVAPGGAYNILAYDLEGTEVASWLNKLGITSIVLKYRVPRRHPEASLKWKAAVQDTQRTVSLVRSRAEEWGIDPNKIGLMGFSAGAHASGMTALLNHRQYPMVDGHDQFSFKPDFVGLIYLGYNLHDEPGIRFTPDLPPFFMAVAQDDGERGILCSQLFIELKKAKVPAELHVYESGGHGYGLRPTEKPVTGWNHPMAAWLKQIGMIE